MLEASVVYREAFLSGLRPEPQLTVSEWADEHRMLSSKASSEPGRWRTSRTPRVKKYTRTWFRFSEWFRPGQMTEMTRKYNPGQ